MKRRQTGLSKRHVMWAIAASGIVLCGFAYSLGQGLSESQFAAGAAADMQCVGNYDPTFPYPKYNPKTKKIGLIGKPCEDTTSGHVTSGTCQMLGKCKGEKVDGMMPMLPMLPMPMPKMMMPMMSPPMTGTGGCADAANASSSTEAGCGGLLNGVTSGISSWLFGSETQTDASASTKTATSDSAWEKLLESLGLSTHTMTTSVSMEQGQGSQTQTQTTVTLNPTQTQKLSPQASGGTGTYTTTDLSKLSQSTFSFSNPGSTFGGSSKLSEITSTLQSILAMMLKWIQ